MFRFIRRLFGNDVTTADSRGGGRHGVGRSSIVPRDEIWLYMASV